MIEPTECERIGPFVESLRDGDLEESSRTSVEAHLRACATCATEEWFWSEVRPEALFPEHRFDFERLGAGPWRARPTSRAVVRARRVLGWGVAAAAAAAVAVVLHLALAPRRTPAAFGAGQRHGHASEQPPTLSVQHQSPAAMELVSEGDVTLEAGDTTVTSTLEQGRR